MCRLAYIIAFGFLVVSNMPVRAQQPDGDSGALERLKSQWAQLNENDADRVTLNHLRGLVRAMHKYEEENGSLPPAVIPNDDLSAERRLSGFVLLLPHLDARDFSNGDNQGARFFDDDLANAAKAIYESIDQTKAWDDPANLAAAQTVVPAFLTPGVEDFRDKHGNALTHFAVVRGALGNDDGAFTDTVGIRFLGGEKAITDGTSSTLAMGQITDDLGPWIAAGPSTSRHVYHPSTVTDAPSFGGAYEGGAYFVNCDSAAFFLDIAKIKPADFHALATRSGGELIYMSQVPRFPTASDWKKAQ